MLVKFKKIHPDTVLPYYERPNDSALAITSIQDLYIPPSDYKILKTGFSLDLPQGFEAQIRSKGILARQHGITVLNDPATIHNNYKDEVLLVLHNVDKYRTFKITKGLIVAQLAITPYTHIDVESSTSIST